MTHIAAILILLGLFISSAQAATDASAYTLSELTVDHSDLSLLRTVSDNYVFTPDLSFRGFGEVSSQIATNGGGGDFSQEMNFNAGQYNGLYGMSAQSNSFAWKGATKIKTSVTGTVSTFAYNPSKDEVESIASGLVVADPGTKKYDLSLSGGHQTITNAITSKLTPYFSTEYSVSLDIPELKTELPLDSFDQTAKLSFAVDNDGIAYYTYNFQRAFEIDDVAFASSMQFAHTGE